MKKINFSIVTSTYNRAASGFLEENIKSVQSQKGNSFEYEHIIVDDGSTDETKKLVEKFANHDSRIKYVYQKNAGPAAAFKKGIAKARNDYLIIVDDDDYLPDDSLAIRAEYINMNPETDWFYGLAEWIDDYGLPMEPKYQSKFFKDHLYERQLISNVVHSGTTTVKTSHAQNVKWPSWLERSQDYFLWLELMRPEKKLNTGFIEKVLFVYRYHTNNYTSQIDGPEKKREKEELNFKIKSLHDDSLYFLAKEAYTWLEEAHKTNKYWKERYETKVEALERENLNLKEELTAMQGSYITGPFVKVKHLKARTFNQLKSLPQRTFTVAPRILPSSIKYKQVDKSQSVARPLISIITPFYNRQDTMPETIRSVLGQSYKNFEYIIIDDGSEKAGQDYLSRIKHPQIKIITQENSGVAEARNNGIRNSSGKYVMCLDSDDVLDSNYIEKALFALESDPEVSIVTFDTKMFGATNDYYFYPDYDPFRQLRENLVLTAAVYRRQVWETVGGYKQDIGYEDWEFWVNAAEHGFFAKHIKEPLFNYRTAHNSRYIDDMDNHQKNIGYIKKLHPGYYRKVLKHVLKKEKNVYKDGQLAKYLSSPQDYSLASNNNKNILLALPWMTFGGAETLIFNFCNEIKNDYNLSFVTAINSDNEWEYKFKKISNNIYHLPNLFETKQQYFEFIDNYIKTRNISVLHIIHNSEYFEFLNKIKQSNPSLKIVMTVFNDRAHFNETIENSQLLDQVTTDNQFVANKIKDLSKKTKVSVIPNGIDSSSTFNPSKFRREEIRESIGITPKDTAVFFVGRLSEEKNPNVFIDVAKDILGKDRLANYKFMMIGDGKMRPEIEEEINKFSSSRLKYLGYKADVNKYLAAADVFVLPSSIEGFPLSILEAMSMKAVVIASDVGAVPDVINHNKNGFIVSPGSSSEIAQIVETLKKDPGKLKTIKVAARKSVEEKYSNIILGENYKDLYNNL